MVVLLMIWWRAWPRHRLTDEIMTGMSADEVIAVAGQPAFRKAADFVVERDIPENCRSVAATVFIYYRRPPERSEYVFFDRRLRVACKGDGLVFNSAD